MNWIDFCNPTTILQYLQTCIHRLALSCLIVILIINFDYYQHPVKDAKEGEEVRGFI